MATPSETVPGVIRECGSQGVEAAIIVSAGFRDMGPEGVEQGPRILEQARAFFRTAVLGEKAQ